MAGFKDQIEPMTLGNMRANGVRSLDVSCWQCHHQAIVSADPWPDDVPVPSWCPRSRTLGNGLFSRTMSAPSKVKSLVSRPWGWPQWFQKNGREHSQRKCIQTIRWLCAGT
jgi:hypothetical protein